MMLVLLVSIAGSWGWRPIISDRPDLRGRAVSSPVRRHRSWRTMVTTVTVDDAGARSSIVRVIDTVRTCRWRGRSLRLR